MQKWLKEDHTMFRHILLALDDLTLKNWVAEIVAVKEQK
jgi:hypothetical protein